MSFDALGAQDEGPAVAFSARAAPTPMAAPGVLWDRAGTAGKDGWHGLGGHEREADVISRESIQRFRP